jgi:hypothetical protein
MATLIVCNWHTECSCGYNRGSYMDRANRSEEWKDANPILHPDSTECPGCGEKFTSTERLMTS